MRNKRKSLLVAMAIGAVGAGFIGAGAYVCNSREFREVMHTVNYVRDNFSLKDFEGSVGGEEEYVSTRGFVSVPGDMDGDGDIDRSDLDYFSACVRGPGREVGEECYTADFDKDGDVDLIDYGEFSRLYSNGN
jgi:hypothetical protein